MCAIQGDPVEVLPWLYIGNAYHASCEDRLAACGISALLNMADSMHDDVTSTSGIDRKRLRHVNIAVADNCSSDIGYCFPQAIQFIGWCHSILRHPSPRENQWVLLGTPTLTNPRQDPPQTQCNFSFSFHFSFQFQFKRSKFKVAES